MSKIWEIEINISYSGVSAKADPEGFNCFNLCFIWLGDVFWELEFHWLKSDFSDLKKSFVMGGSIGGCVNMLLYHPPLPCLSTHADCLDDRICLTSKLCRI